MTPGGLFRTQAISAGLMGLLRSSGRFFCVVHREKSEGFGKTLVPSPLTATSDDVKQVAFIDSDGAVGLVDGFGEQSIVDPILQNHVGNNGTAHAALDAKPSMLSGFVEKGDKKLAADDVLEHAIQLHRAGQLRAAGNACTALLEVRFQDYSPCLLKPVRGTRAVVLRRE